MRLAPVLALLMLPLPLLAQEGTPDLPPDLPAVKPMTAAEFEAHVTGRTLTWAQGGSTFGIEEYLPGRRVRWAFTGDICQEGKWYQAADQICFTYATEPDPQCWTFWSEGDRLRARFAGDPLGTELSEVANSPEPLRCAGPDVGV